MARRITSFILYGAMLLLVIALLVFNLSVADEAFKMDSVVLFEIWFFNFFLMAIFLFSAIRGFTTILKYGNNRPALFIAGAFPFAFLSMFKAIPPFISSIVDGNEMSGEVIALFILSFVGFIGLMVSASLKSKKEIVKVIAVEVFILIILISHFIRFSSEDTFSAVMIMICLFAYMAQVPFLMSRFDIPGASEGKQKTNQFGSGNSVGNANQPRSIYDEIPRQDSGAITFDIPRSEEEDKED